VVAVNSIQSMDSLEAPDMEVTVGSGGQLTVTSPLLLDSGGNVSVVDGGMLTVPGVTSAADAVGINLDDGTLQASEAFATTAPINLGAGGGKIDSNGNNLTLGGTVAGTGSLAITGAGTVALTGANTNTGGVSVVSGMLAAESSAAIPAGSLLSIGPSGSLVLGTPGAAEPLGLPAGGGPIGSSATVAANSSSGAVGSAATTAASSVTTSATIVATAAVPVSTAMTEPSPSVSPGSDTTVAAAAASIADSDCAPSSPQHITRQGPSFMPAPSAVAAGGPGTAISQVISQSESAAGSLDAAPVVLPVTFVAAREGSVPAALGITGVLTQDEVLRSESGGLSSSEVSELSTGLARALQLAWKPDSFAAAVDMVLAGDGRS
jgi:autotransporter-associated beta strand protein